MSNYYFLSSLLPPLQIGMPAELSFKELEPLLKINLSKADYVKVEAIRSFYDIQNLRSMWLGEELFRYGNFDLNELEEAVVTNSGLPDYVYDFLDKYPELEDRLRHYPALTAIFFQKEIERSSGFLHSFFSFEREWRLVAVGFRAKSVGRDLGAELQFEDPADPIVAQMLAQKDAKHFEPSFKYEDLKPIFEGKLDSPLVLHQSLCEYRFAKIDSLVDERLFSIERILGYLIQLTIVEGWLELDKKKGKQMVDIIVIPTSN